MIALSCSGRITSDFIDRICNEMGVEVAAYRYGYVVELMCIHQLSGGASMNKCEAESSSPLAREELCHGFNISRKTMERALELLDLYFEETIAFLWKRLREIYPDLDTDVYVDGSHIRRKV